ncbi:MAG: 30S ribosomal protein S6 [Candidatus Pacebacteria bacterium]|nr:30S ribosomal protein S6 [Candidatus Paceibacterota bacterium]
MKNNTDTGSQEGVYTPEPRVYELGYLLMPSVNEGDLGNERDALVALITKHKGIVISEGQPALIDLAYEMTKVINNKKHTYTQAYFGWIKFDVTPDVVEALTEEVESGASLIRSIMIKTERENLLTSDQPYRLAKGVNEEYEDEEYEDDADESEEDESESSESTEAPAQSISDDLTKIEGIGPKIAELFNSKGIHTYADLSSSKVGDLRDYLADAGLSSHDPKTWSKQATLAKHGKWDELEQLQAELDGGKE